MLIQIRVKPNAKQARLAQQADGTWIAYVNAAPVDGKANAQLIKMLADHFKVARSSIAIQTGKLAKIKLVRISDTD